MVEEEDIELEHFKDCYNIAKTFYSQHKYEEALEVIKDSGLDLKVHYLLEEIRVDCLFGLGQAEEAFGCFEQSCIEVVIELIKKLKYKDALHQIEKSKLDPKSSPKLFKLQQLCLRALEEIPQVKEFIKEVYKLYNGSKYEEGLALIDESKFNVKFHHNLLETRVYCLKKLERIKEAFDGAHYLWKHGYKMSRKLCLIIGDYYKKNEGDAEMAYEFYRSMSILDGISNDDQQIYLKLMKEIDPKKYMEDVFPSGILVDELSQEKAGTLGASSDPKSKGAKRTELNEKSRNDNASDEIFSIALDAKEDNNFITLDGKDDNNITLDGKDDKVDDVMDSVFELQPQEVYVYVGHKKIDMGFDFPVTLIRCSELQLQNLSTLLSLDHINVLKIADITGVNIGDATSNFFIVESVQKVDLYYTSLLKTFRSEYIVDGDDKEHILSGWWNFIAPQFKRIFRDIVDGLIFFLWKGHVCSYDSFVTLEGTGKIFPSMDPGYDAGDIVACLVKQMKKIVYLPNLGHSLEPSWLPKDLLHLFAFLSRDKLKHVPVWWLLDHHFFWKSEEMVDFIFKLRNLYRKRKLGSWFIAYLNVEMHKGYEKFWTDYIPEGIYKDIWRKGDLNLQKPDGSIDEVDELKTCVWYKVAPYLHCVDIIRYMGDVYYHYNDDEFEAEYLDVVDIEQQLRSMFPNIYGYLVNAIYVSVQKDINLGLSSAEKLEALRKLSRRRDY